MKKNAIIDILINDLKEMQLLLSTFKDHSQIDPSFLELLRVKHTNVLREIDLLGHWTSAAVDTPAPHSDPSDEGTTQLDEYTSTVEIDIDTGRIVTEEDEPTIEPEPETPIAQEEPQALTEPEPAPVQPEVAPADDAPKASSTADIINFGRPVNDIRKAISISDRAYFIRELFDGEQHRFDAAIDALNLMNSWDDAQRLIAAYNWPDDDPAVEGFIRAVRRRFIQ